MYTKLFLVSALSILLFGCSDIFTDKKTENTEIGSSTTEQKSNQQLNWFERFLWDDPNTQPQSNHGHSH